jgi:sec-independent protein translocase protein TatB
MDLGMPEMLFILGLALLIFGPAQLPKIGRQIGKALGEFKRASNEFKNQLEDEVRKMELDQMKEEARKAVGVDEMKKAMSLEPAPNTVAQGVAGEPSEPIKFSALSHDPAWEDPERTIQPPEKRPPAETTAPKAGE